MCVDETDSNGRFRRLTGFRRFDVEYSRQAIAVTGRESAGEDIDVVDEVFFQKAERTLVAGKVKWLSQRKAIEQNQHFTGFSAAQIAGGGDPTLHHPWQAAQRANGIVGHVRLVGEIHSVQALRAGGSVGGKLIAACLDDHGVERHTMQARDAGRRDGRRAVRPALALHDVEHRIHGAKPKVVFGQNFAGYTQAIARARLDTHGERIRDEVAAVEESQGFIFELSQHLADAAAFESQFFRSRLIHAPGKAEQRQGEAALAPVVLGARRHGSMIRGRNGIPGPQQNRAILRQ